MNSQDPSASTANKTVANTAREIELSIDAIGARGDGIGASPSGPVFVPLAAPGDRVRVRLTEPRGRGWGARLLAVLAPGPDREVPACRHFGDCGGCSVQHVAPALLAAEKRRQVVDALTRRGLPTDVVMPVLSVPPGTRRRLRLRAVMPGTGRQGGSRTLGFNARARRRVVDVLECPLALPAITDALPALRGVLGRLDGLGDSADVSVTAADSGLDVAIRPDRRGEPTLTDREALASFAGAVDAARLSWDAGHGFEPVAARRPVTVRFGGVSVALPPAAFLQPSAEGEAAIAALAREALADATRVADLYAGCGALTFPIAADAPVHACEGDPAMVVALQAAIRSAARAAGSPPVTAEIRDLARAPLSGSELARFDAVLFDPPRAGAHAQAEALAASTVPTVVAVSCDAATLARDLRCLVDGGYRLERVTPIDQFAWSMHVEAVAVLRKAR